MCEKAKGCGYPDCSHIKEHEKLPGCDRGWTCGKAWRTVCIPIPVGSEKFYTCYVEGTDGGKGYKHAKPEEAKHEATRLAKETGKKVYVMRAISYCEVTDNPVKWTEI